MIQNDRFEMFVTLISNLNKDIQHIKIGIGYKDQLRAIHIMCLHYLYCNESGLTNKELAKLMVEDKAAVSRALTYLKKLEFINYKAEYNFKATITEKGKMVASEIEEAKNRAVDAGGEGLTDEEREKLYEMLQIVSTNLKKHAKEMKEGKYEN